MTTTSESTEHHTPSGTARLFRNAVRAAGRASQ